jgi:hypothetical protein
MIASLFALIGLSMAPSGDSLLTDAEHHFADGVNSRHDADKARKLFAQSAHDYDVLWKLGYRNPVLARNRAYAHRLSGDLPGAIAALRDGLAVARFDRSLQVELEDARSAVAYAHDDLAAQCRPRPVGGIGSRMAPMEAYLAAGLLWLIACLGMARFAMTRVPGWLGISGIALLCLTILGGLWQQDWQRQTDDNSRPLLIVKDYCDLKLGNGEKWPDRLKWRLPPGVEARELSRRGGWVHLELAGGAAGWLPETDLMTSTN